MDRSCSLLSWFFFCMAAVLATVATLAVPENAFADTGSDCANYCIAQGYYPGTSGFNNCVGSCCSATCGSDSGCKTNCCASACGSDSVCNSACSAAAVDCFWCFCSQYVDCHIIISSPTCNCILSVPDNVCEMK